MNEREELATRKELIQSAGDVSRRLRESFGWTQADLALRTGVTRQEISMIECGKKLPEWETICRLANAFGMKDSEFFELCCERREEIKKCRQVAEELAEKYKP